MQDSFDNNSSLYQLDLKYLAWNLFREANKQTSDADMPIIDIEETTLTGQSNY